MAARHTKCGFGTKLGCLQGIRARQSARYIDGMMQAQKPNCVGAIANIIWVYSDCQITNHPSVKQQLGKPWQKFHSNSVSRKQQQTATQDESLWFSGFLQVTVFCYRLVQWMVITNQLKKVYFVNFEKKALHRRQHNPLRMTQKWLLSD